MPSSFVVAVVVIAQAVAASPPKSTRLERLTWPEAQSALRADTVVVIPLGGASVEHGPHLKLGTDLALAEYLTVRVFDASSVVVAPALPYHHYPAFTEYPGSTSLSINVARDLTAGVVRSLARFGPARFYVLNTSASAAPALQAAATALAKEGILLRFTDISAHLATAARNVRQQEAGSHADEIETSMMLHIDAGSVDMRQAARDLSPISDPFRLTLSPGGGGTYSPTGIWGNATLATKDKGRVILDGLVASILDDIESLRTASVPLPTPVARQEPPRSPAPSPTRTGGISRGTCTAGDERTILRISETLTVAWTQQDYELIGRHWARDGDMVHPDGYVERGPNVITENRRELFTRREYRQSRHPLNFGYIRCISPDVAVVDGKWELRGVVDSTGKPVPIMEGLVTLVVKRGEAGGWQIEAYRYTLKPPAAAIPPTFLKRPGYPGGQ